MYGCIYRISVHHSKGDSGQNEAERTNSAVADNIVDGGTLQWENEKRFEGMSEEDIEEMSLEECELYEKNRMERNAWYVTTELTKRIDDAPVLSEYIRAYTSQPKEDLFHFHEPSIILWNSMSSEKNKNKIPGKKLCQFCEKNQSCFPLLDWFS